MTYWPGTKIVKSTDNDFNWKNKPCVIKWSQLTQVQPATVEYKPFGLLLHSQQQKLKARKK